MFQRSFLKWAGGKYGALPNILNTVPEKGSVLVEPFVGSATVALNTNYEKYILSDLNADLIHLFQMITKNPDSTLKDALTLFSGRENNPDAYYKIRKQYNQSNDPDERAILFVYLNRHCYNGLIRYNSSGYFNSPFGRYKAPSIPAYAWHFFAEKFCNARFVCTSFDKLSFHSKPGLTVYADPPYLPASPSASFSSYTKEGFKKKHHLMLDKCAKKWSKKGARVYVSNHDVPLIASCYPNHRGKETFMVPRTISTSIDKRNSISECLLEYF